MPWNEMNKREKVKYGAKVTGLIMLLNSPLVTWVVSAYGNIRSDIKLNRESIIKIENGNNYQKDNIARIEDNIRIIRDDIKRILARGNK